MKISLPLIIFSILTSVSAFAQQLTSQDTIRAYRLQYPIKIDGILDEKVWQETPGIDQFYQQTPDEGKAASERTVIRIAYDDHAVYIGARMYDSNPDSIIARLSRRDDLNRTDVIVFMIDPYLDRRGGFFFSLTPRGSIVDGTMFNDEGFDMTWDAVWEGRASIDSLGWTAEFRIPFSQLRFKKTRKQVWGVNFLRDITRKNETSMLVFTPRGSSGFVSRFPKLVGIHDIKQSKNIEVLPYVRSKFEMIHAEPGDPFNDGFVVKPGIGADFKIGISSNLTLNGTINPDFGQVEVDPAVVNLTDVETFYFEKRPFFVEGASIYEFGTGGTNDHWNFNWMTPNFFYSRRIGAAPRGSVPANDYIDRPEGTSILGAAKLSGKLHGNWNMGFMSALTKREFARIEKDGLQSESEIEPLTSYNVFRMQKERDQGFQGIGLIATGAVRNFDDNRLRDEFNNQSYSFGADGWTFLDNDRRWVITGWGGYSHISGSKQRMLDVQQSPIHYFQRPDQNHVSVDSLATSLDGYSMRISVNKQKGNWILNSAFGMISPGFNVNDLGYMNRADKINAHMAGGYRWTKPDKFKRYLVLLTSVYINMDYNHKVTGKGFWNRGSIQFPNYWSFSLMAGFNPQTYNNTRTRGGPLTINNPSQFYGLEFETNQSKDVVFTVQSFIYKRTDGFKESNIGFGIDWKPLPNLMFSFQPTMSWTDDNVQWIKNAVDETALDTYGTRYIFSDLQQKTFSAGIRANWTFTPRLSFQLYAQPLFSTGNFYGFKELAEGGTFDFNVYGEGNSTIEYNDGIYTADPDGANGPAPEISWYNPDYNFGSVRGNAVLRWEYLPGSTLYFVWTQNRTAAKDEVYFDIGRSMDVLINSEADNVFMIKMTYWLNI